MKHTKNTFLFLLLCALTQGRTQVVFEWNTAELAPGDTLQAVLTTRNFEELVSFQFAVEWDTTQLQPIGEARPELDNLAIGLSPGKMALSWFPAEGQAVSLEDQSVIVALDFLVVACEDSPAMPVLIKDAFPRPEAAGPGGSEIAIEIPTGKYPLLRPELIRGDTLYVCEGAELELIAQNCPDCAWLWSTGNRTERILAKGDQTYSVSTVNNIGCTFSDTVRTKTISLPPLPLPTDTTFCAGDSIRLAAAVEAPAYRWSTGDTTAGIWLKTAGNYELTVTDENGCERQGSTQVRLTPQTAANLVADPETICRGDTTTLLPGGGHSYELLDSTDRFLAADEKEFTISPSQTAFYQAIAFGECGRDTAGIIIEVIIPEVSATEDTCIGRGEMLELRAEGGIQYRWLPSEYEVSDPDIANPVTMPEDSTYYYVEITDLNGCSALDTVFVAVADDPANFLRPVNVLTPNGDGKNDVLKITNLEKFAQNRLTIFNRWGKIIYKKENYQRDDERWDGRYNGKPLPAGMYFYILEVDEFIFKQSLMILRNK
jgi:gliding motility-associated-like protein